MGGAAQKTSVADEDMLKLNLLVVDNEAVGSSRWKERTVGEEVSFSYQQLAYIVSQRRGGINKPMLDRIKFLAVSESTPPVHPTKNKQESFNLRMSLPVCSVDLQTQLI